MSNNQKKKQNIFIEKIIITNNNNEEISKKINFEFFRNTKLKSTIEELKQEKN